MYKTSAKLIRKELDYLMQMCDQVYEIDLCESCPMESHCLRDRTIEDIWSEVSEGMLADFLYYADTRISQEDMYYIKMDNQRKSLIEDF